jgi:repressor LexA
LRRDPTKPRALEVRYDASSGVTMERRPAKYIPLVGEVAAGVNVLAQENVEDLVPLPMDFTGDGELFMLKVRGESMIEAGILDGDFVVCRQQNVARNGDVVVVGIPGDEATVKTFKRDYARVNPRPDTISVLQRLGEWFEDYNTVHPHSGLRFQSPREFIQQQSTQQATCPV